MLSFVSNLMMTVAEATGATGLSSVVTQDMLSGVLDEVIALLPIAIPVVISFIALRKGISFLIGILRSA